MKRNSIILVNKRPSTDSWNESKQKIVYFWNAENFSITFCKKYLFLGRKNPIIRKLFSYFIWLSSIQIMSTSFDRYIPQLKQ